MPISTPGPFYLPIFFLNSFQTIRFNVPLSQRSLSNRTYTLMLVLQTPYGDQKALPELAWTNTLYPISKGPLSSNNDDFMFFQHGKLSPTSGALPLLFPLPGVYFPQSRTSKASSRPWTCSSDVTFSERPSLTLLLKIAFKFLLLSFMSPYFLLSSHHHLYLIYWFVYLFTDCSPTIL